MAEEAQIDALIVCGSGGEVYEIPWNVVTSHRADGSRKEEIVAATQDDTTGHVVYKPVMLPSGLMTYVSSGGTIVSTSTRPLT